MDVFIKVIRDEFSGEWLPEPTYVKSCNFDADGLDVTLTGNIADAMCFKDTRAALDYYCTQSQTRPLRIDRKPNRPLTQFTIELFRKGT